MLEAVALSQSNTVSNLKDRVNDYLSQHGIQKVSLAKTIGVKDNTLRRFLSDPSYENKDIESALLRFMDTVQEHYQEQKKVTSFGSELKFYNTTNTQRIVTVIEDCIEDNSIGVIFGDPGSGKTRTLEEYVKRKGGAIYFMAGAGMTNRDFIERLAEAIGAQSTGSPYDIIDSIINNLLEDPRAIIIDEAENAIKSSVTKIEWVRRIQDKAKMPLILAGTYLLEERLRKGPSRKENLSVFTSRIDFKTRLSLVEEDEVRNMLKDFDINEGGIKEIVSRVTDRNRNGLRTMTKILKRAVKLADGGVITTEIVKAADRMLVV